MIPGCAERVGAPSGETFCPVENTRNECVIKQQQHRRDEVGKTSHPKEEGNKKTKNRKRMGKETNCYREMKRSCLHKDCKWNMGTGRKNKEDLQSVHSPSLRVKIVHQMHLSSSPWTQNPPFLDQYEKGQRTRPLSLFCVALPTLSRRDLSYAGEGEPAKKAIRFAERTRYEPGRG